MMVSPESGGLVDGARSAIDTSIKALLASAKIRAGKGLAREELDWPGRGRA
jgi:hypothetical protein